MVVDLLGSRIDLYNYGWYHDSSKVINGRFPVVSPITPDTTINKNKNPIFLFSINAHMLTHIRHIDHQPNRLGANNRIDVSNKVPYVDVGSIQVGTEIAYLE